MLKPLGHDRSYSMCSSLKRFVKSINSKSLDLSCAEKKAIIHFRDSASLSPMLLILGFFFIFVIKLMLLPLFRLETISRKQLFNSRIFSFTIYIKIETWQIYPDPRYLTLRFNTHQVKSLKFEGNKH